MSSKKFQFTSMKKKSNNNNGKAANQKFQPTLFQTWGSKNTVSNSSTTTTDTRTTNVPSTSNYSGDINNHDITIVSENDVDLLLQALEDDERLSATTGTVQSNDGEGTGVAAIESNWDIDLDNIPDLPGFDKFAGRLWIYPTNYPVREYQYNIVKEALFTNTLVVLPTGLGKTFIAAVVMFNFYRWYPSGIVLFLAPTKPLVAQQIEACYNIMGIPQSDMAEMTGKQMPASRRQMWDEKRILFLTPQVLINDLTRGTCVAARIKCIVLDEAHKSLGNYAYCQVIREVAKQNPDFRVLALSATPGNTLKSVQEVLTNLMITAVAIRTEECPDVKKYSNERRIETIVVPLGPVIEDIQKKYVEILESIVNRLATRRLLFNMKVQTITKFSVLKARNAFRQKPPQNLSPSAMGCIEGDFGLLITLCHGHELLQLHGLRSFYQYISNMGDSTSSRSKRELFKNPMFVQIYEKLRTDYEQNISFTQMSSQQRSVPYAVGHPKLEKLLEIVVNHFKSFQKENGHLETRVMIFSQYRNSVTDIAEMLKRERPLVRAMTFIGQSSGKNTKGFTQKEQIKVMKDFRDGGFNTLIATCVGEEGLDIGEVDLIVCFDTCKSPVRLVQRMGRTGRKREGRIIMLVTKGKEEQMYKQAKYQWNSISRSLKEGYSKLALSSHQPKLIPEGLQPRCLKVDIVVPETFCSVHEPKQKPKKIPKKKKTTAPPLTQNILQFTSPEVSLLDYLPQPSTSKSGKEDSTERAMKERRFSRLSSDEESELLNLGLKERLLSKKAGKDTGKSGGKKNKKKKTGTKDQGDMEKRAKETTTKGARNELRCSDEEMEFEPLTREDTVCLSDKDIGLKPFLREDTNNGKVASSSRNADDHESCKDFPEPSLVEFSDSDIFPDLKLQPEMSKEGSDSLNQISHDDDGGGGDGRLSPVVSLKSVKSDKGLSQTTNRNPKSSSVVTAAPDICDLSKLIDDFYCLLSSIQPHELDVESLVRDWDTEFAPGCDVAAADDNDCDVADDDCDVVADDDCDFVAAGDVVAGSEGCDVVADDDDDARTKGSSGLAQSTVDVLIQDLIRPDVLKRTAEPSLLSVTRTQSSPNLFDDDDYFLSDESFVMNNDLDPVSQVKLTDDTKVEPEMKPEMSNKNTSVSKADYSSLTSPISGLCCSSVDTPSPVGQTETKIKTDGIYFDLSTDLFSDDCDFTGLTGEINTKNNDDSDNSNNNNNHSFSIGHKSQTLEYLTGQETGAGCSAGNIPLLSSKLSSLINCHTTIKDSSTNSSCKHLEDSINFDLEFDSVFRPSDGAGQRSNSGFIDDPVGFDLQFDSDEDGWKIPEEKDEPGTSSANSSNSDSRRNYLGRTATATTTSITTRLVIDEDDDDGDDELMFMKRKRKAVISSSSEGSTPRSEVKGLASRLKKGWLTTKRSTPKPAVVSRNKRRKIGKINDNEGYQFLDVEAEVTGSEEEADDEEEEAVDDTENHYGGSFIDEDYTSGNTQVDMTAVYLKSVISPVCKPRGYKLQYSHHVSEVYSQLSESDIDCYEPDSFLDDSEIPMSDSVSANATQEIVLQAQRPKPKGPVKRRVIRCISSSSEEEEEKGKETNMEPPQTEVQKKISHHQHQQPLSKDHTRSSVSHDISAGKSTSSSQQHPLPAPQGVILADSRTISGAQEILSNLKSKYDIPVEVVKLKAADYAVSDRTGVVRMYQSDAYSVTNNHKMTNRLQQLTSLYDRPCFIIEKDPFKKGLASTKTPLHQTKYYEKLLSYIGRSPTRLLFSGNKDETCTLLAELFLQEKMKGFAIEDLRLNNKQEQKLKFLLTFPDLNYALALNICKNFTSMGELLSSCVAEIACKGNMSEDRADFIYQYIHKEPSNKP